MIHDVLNILIKRNLWYARFRFQNENVLDRSAHQP